MASGGSSEFDEISSSSRITSARKAVAVDDRLIDGVVVALGIFWWSVGRTRLTTGRLSAVVVEGTASYLLFIY